MSEIVIRLSILALIGIISWLFVWAGRRFVEAQRRRALATAPLSALLLQDKALPASDVAPSLVHILAFSTPDCRQCHQLQAPALQRVLEAREETIKIVEVDATTEHNLVQAYHVLTVPSTVVLDAVGNACAINYGFATTQLLLSQIDKLLAKGDTSCSAVPSHSR
jgi:thioredoxin-like negative regulator of GroEL